MLALGAGHFNFSQFFFYHKRKTHLMKRSWNVHVKARTPPSLVLLLMMLTVNILVHVLSRFLSSPPLPLYLHLSHLHTSPLFQSAYLQVSDSFSPSLSIKLNCFQVLHPSEGAIPPLRTHPHGLIPILQGSWK